MTSVLAPDADFWEALGGSAAAGVTHELIWVHGPDAVSFTDSLLSQNIAAMHEGAVKRSFLLAPTGKLRALLWVLRGRDEVGVVSDVGFAATVANDLARFKLRVEVEIDPEPVELYSILGPASEALGGGWSRLGDDVLIRADLGAVPRQLTTTVPDGVALLSDDLAEALRIEAGEPRMGVDVDEGTIPQETGLVPAAVDFDKGCYLGQELVARIDSRGHVNQRLVAIETGDVAPPPGSEVVADGRDVGSLSSVAWSPTLGAHLGLGVIRREAADGVRVDIRWPGSQASGLIRPVATAD